MQVFALTLALFPYGLGFLTVKISFGGLNPCMHTPQNTEFLLPFYLLTELLRIFKEYAHSLSIKVVLNASVEICLCL